MLKIKDIRTNKGLTQDELAVKSGVSKRMIAAYEANENDITLSRLQNIARALDVHILELIDIELPFEKNPHEYAVIDNETLAISNDGLIPYKNYYDLKTKSYEQSVEIIDLLRENRSLHLENKELNKAVTCKESELERIYKENPLLQRPPQNGKARYG